MPLSRRRFVVGLGVLGTAGALGVWRHLASRRAGVHRRSAPALGTTVSLTVLHDDRRLAERACAAGFDAIEQVERVMSLYRPDSQLCRLNRDGRLADPHPELLTVLTAAEELSRLSDGAFDVTVQPLWKAFADAARGGGLPPEAEIAAARGRVDWRRVESTARGIRLRGEGTAVTLNGIAQGLAVDKVTHALRAHGIENALIDTGELAGLGRRQDQSPWRIGIRNPRAGSRIGGEQSDAEHYREEHVALADLDGRCLATSGDDATTFTADRVHHHIFDPRTGRSPTELASVSVVAPSGLWADGLSTALCVLGPEAGRKLLDLVPNTDALFVLKSGEIVSTPGFPVCS